MIEGFVRWCNQVNPQSESENMVICYGAKLLFENCLKLLVLFVIGFAIGKGYETIIFLVVFCGLRTQAGGYHAKTGTGCALCMLAVWLIGMLCNEILYFSFFQILFLVFCFITIIILEAPKTINRHCYSTRVIKQKKIYSVIIVGMCAVIAIEYHDWRTLIMVALILEVFTLLPIKNIRRIMQ